VGSAIAWFAWSLMILSVVLVLGGVSLSVATKSVVAGLPNASEAFLASGLYNLATLLRSRSSAPSSLPDSHATL